MTAVYSGDTDVAGSDASGTLTVTKAKPKMKVKVRPDSVVRKKTVVKLDVSVDSDGRSVGGEVRIVWGPKGDRHERTQSLKHGDATFKIGPFKKVGKQSVKVIYLGNDNNERVTDTVTFRVRRS